MELFGHVDADMLHGFQSMKPSLLKIGQLPEENNVGSMRMNYNELDMLKFICCFNVSFSFLANFTVLQKT